MPDTAEQQIFLPWVSKPFTGATLCIRRVEYDNEREIKALGQSGLPGADWIVKPFWPPRQLPVTLRVTMRKMP